MNLDEFEQNELDNIKFQDIEIKMYQKPTRNLKRSVRKWLPILREFEKVLKLAGFQLTISKIKKV
jgi:hypothetical protein